MFPIISCKWGKTINVICDFSVIIHMNFLVSKLVNYFSYKKCSSFKKTKFLQQFVVIIQLLFILFFSFFQQIFIEALLCAGTVLGTNTALELLVPTFQREQTENKPMRERQCVVREEGRGRKTKAGSGDGDGPGWGEGSCFLEDDRSFCQALLTISYIYLAASTKLQILLQVRNSTQIFCFIYQGKLSVYGSINVNCIKYIKLVEIQSWKEFQRLTSLMFSIYSTGIYVKNIFSEYVVTLFFGVFINEGS